MTSQQITVFLSLAETLNFSGTAKKLFISQPVVSRHLAALESELGFPLFIRTRQYVKLTPAGEVILEYFRRAREEFEPVREKALRLAQGKGSTISVGLLELFDNSRILSAIGRFSGAVMRVERHFAPCAPEALLTGKYDVGISFKNLVEDYPDIYYHEFFKTQDVLIMSKKSKLADAGRINVSDIGEICLVSEDGKTPANFPPERMARCGIEHCTIVTLSNISSVLAAVESGLYCTIIQDFSLPFLRFPYVSLPLESFHSIGLAWTEPRDKPFIKEFVKLCLE